MSARRWPPYQVVEDEKGCEHCSTGRTVTVQYPDGETHHHTSWDAIGRSEEADTLARDLNATHRAVVEKVMTIIDAMEERGSPGNFIDKDELLTEIRAQLCTPPNCGKPDADGDDCWKYEGHEGECDGGIPF